MRIPTNKNFGLVFASLFLIIFIFFYFIKDIVIYFLLISSFIFFILGILNSKILFPLNLLWYEFGLFLTRILNPVIISFIYFLVVVPISLLLKIFGKDFMNLKKNNLDSYWVQADKNSNKSMDDQF
tara:strand:- start:392 stop:769 length:378 start_codon:yes stop_codon:yes gene_type:complete